LKITAKTLGTVLVEDKGYCSRHLPSLVSILHKIIFRKISSPSHPDAKSQTKLRVHSLRCLKSVVSVVGNPAFYQYWPLLLAEGQSTSQQKISGGNSLLAFIEDPNQSWEVKSASAQLLLSMLRGSKSVLQFAQHEGDSTPPSGKQSEKEIGGKSIEEGFRTRGGKTRGRGRGKPPEKIPKPSTPTRTSSSGFTRGSQFQAQILDHLHSSLLRAIKTSQIFSSNPEFPQQTIALQYLIQVKPSQKSSPIFFLVPSRTCRKFTV
jgi:hypothetical protein